MTFTIDFPPTGKARPRVTRHGTYTPQKTKEYEELVKWSYVAAKGKMHEGAVRVTIKAYFTPPKSTSKATKQLMLTDQIYPTTKPDADNIVKACTDALNGIAYKDDSYVVDLIVYKRYRDVARVEMSIEEM